MTGAIRSSAAKVLPVAVVVALSGCVDLAPAHRRPDAPIASSWSSRGAAGADIAARTSEADRPAWPAFIVDDRLRATIARSLERNRDLRIAVLNVEKARAQYRAQDAARAPSLFASAAATRTRTGDFVGNAESVTVGVPGYEVDLFGRLKNLGAAALASYLASDEARRSARVLLVGEVAMAWLTLAADQERLAITLLTLDSQRRTLDLVTKVRALGGSSGLAVAQVQSTVEAARVQAAQLRTAIALDRNALDLLLGEPFDDALDPQGRLPPEAGVLIDVPADLPSTVLLERPDVVAAEYTLKATEANIGAARAAYFPRIVLTGSGGLSSVALDRLFRGGSTFWGFGPSISLPIFDGGFNDANLAFARADREVAIAAYERTLQSAFKEVADVLAARRTLAERRAGQQAFIDALATSLRLSDAIFRQGGSSYLTVLEAQRSLYGAQQTLVSLRLEEQTTRIALYKALGGGWNDRDER